MEKSVNYFINFYRTKRGYTIAQTSRESGISVRQWGRFEHDTVPRPPHLITICEYLGITPELLFQNYSKELAICAISEYLRRIDKDKLVEVVSAINNLFGVSVSLSADVLYERESLSTDLDLSLYPRKLQSVRKSFGLTQTAMCERMEYGLEYYSQVENGKAEPSTNFILSASEATIYEISCFLSNRQPLPERNPSLFEQLNLFSSSTLYEICSLLELFTD